jgi:predicted site-specific integrase-resolvase
VFVVANVSIREAVKLYQVSRPTLTKSLKNGKISGVQDDKGQWKIDPAELARIYRPRTAGAATSGKDASDNFTNNNTNFPGEVETLKARVAEAEQRAAVAEALAEERRKHIEDLRRMLPAPQEAQRPSWRWPWKR